MAQVVVGGIGDADLIESCGRVSSGSAAQLDTTALARHQKEAVPKEKHQPEAAGDSQLQAPSYLTREQARAVIFAKLVTLVTGSTGAQPELLSFLNELLSHNITPQLPAGETDNTALDQLAGACRGEGQCRTSNSPGQQSLAEALQSMGCASPGVSSAERISIQRRGPATCGVAALAMFSNRKLSVLATAVAALSCEALQAVVRSSFELFTSHLQHIAVSWLMCHELKRTHAEM